MGELALAVAAAYQAEWPLVGPWQSFGEVEFELDVRWALYHSASGAVLCKPVEATPGPPDLVAAFGRADEDGWF